MWKSFNINVTGGGLLPGGGAAMGRNSRGLRVKILHFGKEKGSKELSNSQDLVNFLLP